MRRSKKYSNVYVQPRKLIITKKKKKKKYSKKGNMVMKIYTKVNKLLIFLVVHKHLNISLSDAYIYLKIYLLRDYFVIL